MLQILSAIVSGGDSGDDLGSCGDPMLHILSAIVYGLFFGFVGFIAGLMIMGFRREFIRGDLTGEELLTGLAVGSACGMIIGIIYGIIKSISEEAKLRREEQEGYCKQMVILCEGSLAIFESMPEHLDSAEKWLDQAEADFAEGAFAPFWDSVENAANWLARFAEGVRQIKDKSSHYSELIGKYEDAPPRFLPAPQSVEKLGVGTATAERMKAIVRAAQRNFQFAMIYEQRKTNQILVAGFKTLAEALEQMTWQITASLDPLADSVNTSLRAIDSRLDEMAAMSRQHHYEMMEQVSEVAEREREVVEKLDNIQRHR